jgi:4-diphosphocytidyl-2-C-methyl-D-erythritol kinase
MLVALAPAKVNLTLEVLDRRADGFHGIRSLMVPLALSDELSVEPHDRFSFESTTPLATGEKDLALRAIEALGAPLPAARVRLRKHVPAQAGLGGGSSDAAAVLLAAIEGAFGPPPSLDWLATARTLGSDVPFFLAGTAALVEGTGERVTAVGAIPQWQVVIVKPPSGLSTAQAYARIDAEPHASRPRNGSVTLEALEALQRGDFAGVAARLTNDFHAIAHTDPAIARSATALRDAGAKHVLLAGSGSAVFALVEERDESARIVRRLALPDGYAVFATQFADVQTSWRS